LAFWFLELSGFLFVIMMTEFFLSGHLVPLNILPVSMQPFLLHSPFGYEGYWPCAILMGKVPAEQMPQVLGLGVLWVLVFYAISQLMWKAGLKRYSAVGGGDDHIDPILEARWFDDEELLDPGNA